VFRARGLSFGIGLCWDWHFPEVATIYSLKGAEVLFAPHASPTIIGDRKEIWLRYLCARAYDNSVYLVPATFWVKTAAAGSFKAALLFLAPKEKSWQKVLRSKKVFLLANYLPNILISCVDLIEKP
jgi:predicted amidohydrolase